MQISKTTFESVKSVAATWQSKIDRSRQNISDSLAKEMEE